MLRRIFLTTLLVLAALSTAAPAATILLGGDTLDGNFEADVVDGTANPTAGGWYPTGNTAYVVIKDNKTVVSGNNVFCGRDIDDIHRFGRSTGHTIATGDRFDGGFSWLLPNSAFPVLSIDMNLFYTDDDSIGGTRTTFATWNSGSPLAQDVTQNEVFALTAAGAANAGAGKTLFMSIDPVTDSDKNYARVDDVFLNLTTVPEPTTMSLLAIGGVALLRRRRRRRA